MQKTLLNIFKKILLIFGIILGIVLNLYISNYIWVALIDKTWYWDIVTKLNELIYPPLHHFEWNTLKPNSTFVWYVWKVVKILVRQSPICIPLFLLGNVIVYAKRKTLPKRVNVLMLPLNYIKVIVLSYYITNLIIVPLLLSAYLGIIQLEHVVMFSGPVCSHVFWLSIFFAWRQISLRDKPRKKFYLPSFPKVSPSPTL